MSKNSENTKKAEKELEEYQVCVGAWIAANRCWQEWQDEKIEYLIREVARQAALIELLSSSGANYIFN